MSSSDSTGLLLIAHGTRSAAGVEQFLALANSIGQRAAPLPVEPAFLELAKPDIDEAVDRLLARGINHLVTIPLLLFAAGHIKRDIPRAVAASLAHRGKQQIEQTQADHLGCHAAIVELSRRRIEEAVRHASCLLLVARGSRDDSATAEMYDFARLRSHDVGWAPPAEPKAGTAHPNLHVEVAFLAMAQPLLSKKLAEVAARGYGRVIVQPHLLFDGELIDSIGTQVAAMASKHPETDWLVTPPLADRAGFITLGTPLLQKVIFDRLDAAGIHVVAPAGDD